MDRKTILENVSSCRERLNAAAQKWGGVEICAVSKTVDVETINFAHDAGIRVIGENRVQELMSKADGLNPAFEKHIIGSLQTNKVKYIMDCADMVQSLDRDALAEEISRRAVQAGRVMPVLVQVNLAKEPQKGGVYEEDLIGFLERCAKLEGLSVRGLMAIMPLVPDPEQVRPLFRRMRSWFDRLREHPVENTSMEILSMGMSADCIVAAEEGATMIRLGRAIFGTRPNITNSH